MDCAELTASPLFRGVAPEEIQRMMTCLSITPRSYPRDACIISAGDAPQELGVVVTGSVHLIKEDYWGNRAIIALVKEGGVFGEACSCPASRSAADTAIAAEDCEVLFLDYRKVTTTCSNVCPFHTALIQNMLGLIAAKNVQLTSKISHLVKRTTRDKLLSYFSEQAEEAGRNSFTIPYNRQELADYLSVDRSAMSTELSKLQKEGVIRYTKNEFTLL